MSAILAKAEPETKAAYFIIPLACVFCLNPLIGLTLTYLLLVISSQSSSRADILVKFYCIALGVFLGAVNSSKIPENDLIWYYAGYLDVARYGFLDYISSFGINGQGKEIAFPALNYVIYQFIGPNTDIYILLITILCYGTINISAYKFSKSLGLSPACIATAVFLFSIAPNIFSVSAVILRQNLAAALVIYIIVERFSCNRNNYFLMVVSVFVHASSLFFIALCFLPGIKKRVSLNTLPIFLAVAVIILTYQYVAGFALGFVSSDNVFSYALSRASTGTNYELPPLGLARILFDVAMAGAMFWVIYFMRPALKENQGAVAISNIVLLSLLFIISNLNYVELSVRFNAYYLSFFPFVVAIVLSTLRHRFVLPFLIAFHPAFWIIFVYGLYISMWSYVAKIEIAYWPLFYYFMD